MLSTASRRPASVKASSVACQIVGRGPCSRSRQRQPDDITWHLSLEMRWVDDRRAPGRHPVSDGSIERHQSPLSRKE